MEIGFASCRFIGSAVVTNLKPFSLIYLQQSDEAQSSASKWTLTNHAQEFEMPVLKPAKAAPPKSAPVPPPKNLAAHEELLADMDVHRIEVTSSPEAAMAFLKRAGFVTSSGKPRQLIRG